MARAPIVVAVEMGLGHLRAALPVARALGQPLLHADQPPLVDDRERRIWRRSRGFYEPMSRLAAMPGIGLPLRGLLGAITHIPHLHPARDLTAPSVYTRFLERMIARGLGRGLAETLRREGAPLFTTFFVPALAAVHHGCDDVTCLVTDSDIARAWVPRDPAKSRIRYLAPSDRAVRRLRAYGVDPARIELTGFPLPDELVGGPELPILRRNLARRLVALDPSGEFRGSHGGELARMGVPAVADQAGDGRPPLLVFAVGGAGAQADLAGRFLPSLRKPIETGRLRL